MQVSVPIESALPQSNTLYRFSTAYALNFCWASVLKRSSDCSVNLTARALSLSYILQAQDGKLSRWPRGLSAPCQESPSAFCVTFPLTKVEVKHFLELWNLVLKNATHGESAPRVNIGGQPWSQLCERSFQDVGHQNVKSYKGSGCVQTLQRVLSLHSIADRPSLT